MVHYNRISAFLIGALLTGGLFMTFVATQNFATVDRILSSPPPEAAKTIQTLGADNARHLLRYMAGEENRGFFESWELAELILCLALTAIQVFGPKNYLLAGFAGALAILTAFQHLRITPDLVSIGRSSEFLSGGAQSAIRHQFGVLHAIYGGIELMKLGIVLTIAGFLLASRRRRGKRRVEVDAINHADHGHINR